MALPKFYVYVHTRNDTGKVFYVGKGSGRRAFVHTRRSQHWKNIVAKHGYSVTEMARFDLECDAFSAEIALIAKLRNDGVELVNRTPGGEGVAGLVHSAETRIAIGLATRNMSEETRQKRCKSMKAYNAKLIRDGKRKTISQETRQKISASVKARGYVHTAEALEKIRAHATGKHYAKGYRHTESTIEKIREAGRRPCSEETRRKISESHLARVRGNVGTTQERL